MEIHEWKMMKHGQVSKGKLDFYFDFQILFTLNQWSCWSFGSDFVGNCRIPETCAPFEIECSIFYETM